MNLSLVPRAKKRAAVMLAAASVVSTLAIAGAGGGNVLAHDLTISGSASCADDGKYTINYTVTAWAGDGTDASRTHPNVQVTASFNSNPPVSVGSGEFNAANGFSFSGSFVTPAGTNSVFIYAVTVGPWANNFGGNQQSTATVSLPTNCGTTTTTTTTTTEPPTTTTTTTSTTTTTTTTSTTTTTTAPPGFEGLTPGYWKNHTAAWQGFATSQTLESVFDVPDSYGLDNVTLLNALSFQGGSTISAAAQILLRAGVAALLNSASSNVDYPLTTAQVIAEVNAALASGDRATILAEATRLDNFNNLGA